MVNLEWYRTFKAVYQEGNLTKAAKELLISQPNVSVQLAALENHVGHKLFDRLPRRVVPTGYGKLLYTQIVGSVENLEKVEAEFSRSSLKQLSTIRLGTPVEYFHTHVVNRLPACLPGIDAGFGMARDLIDRLVTQELDFVIATQLIEKAGIVYEPIVDETFWVVAGADFDDSQLEKLLTGENRVEVEKYLLEQSWVAFDNKLSLIRRFWLQNFGSRPLIKPRYVIPEINTMLKLLTVSDTLAIVSDLLLAESLVSGQVKVLWKGDSPATNTVYLAYNPSLTSVTRLNEIRKLVTE